jgi:L-ascorbate metabolism protein UlaG (beta-lactamase superfamily)
MHRSEKMDAALRERIEASPQFKDGRFQNSHIPDRKPDVPSATILEFAFGGAKRRPHMSLPVEDPRESWLHRPETGLRVTWLGHSTALIEIDGHRILTDPVWSERISPVPLLGPRRFHRAPVSIAELPPLDAVLLSHDHYDHLDMPTVRELARLRVPFVTSLGVGPRLEGVETIHELDWWETITLGGLTFTATPAQHFSGRSPFDRNRTLWSSWVVTGEKHRFFFSGDTGLTPDFEKIGQLKGPFDLVMLEVGAFHESWGDIHLGPENALIAHRMLGSGTLLPVHWGTFDLALHPWDEPAETLIAKAGNIQLVTPRLGRAIEPSRIERIDPWWREAGAVDRELAPA